MDSSLRRIKKELLNKLSSLEKGSLNHYVIESYLLDHYPPCSDYDNIINNEEDFETTLKNILSIIRDDPKFWFENSEIYMNIIKKNGDITKTEFTNKALYSVYNYIHLNPIYHMGIEEEKFNEDIEVEINEEDNTKISLEEHVHYCFNFNVLRLLANYLIKDKGNITSLDKIKIQNMLMYFVLSNNIEKTTESFEINKIIGSKKYTLRKVSKDDEEKEIMHQVKMIEYHEKIENLKKRKNIFDFMSWGNLITISPYENVTSNSRFQKIGIEKEILSYTDKLPFILKVYTILNNILLIGLFYVSELVNNNATTTLILSRENAQNLLNSLQDKIYTEDSIQVKQLYQYYTFHFDNDAATQTENSILIRLGRKKYKREENKETLESIEKACDSYINGYYNRDDVITHRKYYEEFAGFDWTEEDLQRFQKGCEIYNNASLPNQKIAKYMGKHIFPSHVKALRSKIARALREEKREQRFHAIQQMMKKRNKKWKVLSVHPETK